MVEVTQEDREAAARYWGNDNPPLELQREFARHRIAALEEAWRDGFDNARSVVPEYAAHDLTEDVEDILWCDSKTAREWEQSND